MNTVEECPSTLNRVSIFRLQETRSKRDAAGGANRWLPWTAALFLILTAAISLAWSSCKLLWFDEFLVLWTDSQRSIADVARIQSTWPISLDPLVFHAATNLAVRVFGSNAFAIRFTALLGYLVMQICLFLFVRRVAAERTAVCALALPALSGVLWFAVEGRPYGLMLGLFGVAMVSWQAGTRRETRRAIPLIALASAIALAVNTHYFGVLLIPPLLIAEAVRAIQRRRIDAPMLAAIGLGCLGVVFALPFMRAASDFRVLYSRVPLKPGLIAGAYVGMITHHASRSREQGVLALLIAVLGLIILWSCIRQLRSRTIVFPQAELVFLVALAALPFFGYPLAVFATHAYEDRYVFSAVIGVSALLAISVDPLLRRNRPGRLVLASLMIMVILIGIIHLHSTVKQTRGVVSKLTVTPELKRALLQNDDKNLYFQDTGTFAQAVYYEPDPEISSRMVLVSSRAQEMHWTKRDTLFLTESHMREFTQVAVADYEAVAKKPGNHVFVSCKDPELVSGEHGWNWTDEAFRDAKATVNQLGSAFGCNVVAVRFP